MNSGIKDEARPSLHAPAPRGRRLDRVQRQSEILDAAYELFAENGYGATTINDIATGAGVAKGLVLFHFKSKEGVFQAVVRRAIPPLLNRLDFTDSTDRQSARELFCSTMREVYHYLVESPEAKVIIRLLIAEGRRFPELNAFYHSEVVARGNAVLSKVIEMGVKQGEFSVRENENVSRVLIAPLISALFWQLLFADIEQIDVKKLYETHIDLALHGLIRTESRLD